MSQESFIASCRLWNLLSFRCPWSLSSHVVCSGASYLIASPHRLSSHLVASRVVHLNPSPPGFLIISSPLESLFSCRPLGDLTCHLVASRVFQCAPGPLISSHCTRSHSFNNETYYRNRTSHLVASGVAHLNPSPPGSIIISSPLDSLISCRPLGDLTSQLVASGASRLISLSSESLIST